MCVYMSHSGNKSVETEGDVTVVTGAGVAATRGATAVVLEVATVRGAESNCANIVSNGVAVSSDFSWGE